MEMFFIIVNSIFLTVLIYILIHIKDIKKNFEKYEYLFKVLDKHEYLFEVLDKHAWKIEYIYDFSLHTKVVIDAINRQSMDNYKRLKVIHDRIIDDRKPICENCIHSEVCTMVHGFPPISTDLEMKDKCKHFEMKSKNDAK